MSSQSCAVVQYMACPFMPCPVSYCFIFFTHTDFFLKSTIPYRDKTAVCFCHILLFLSCQINQYTACSQSGALTIHQFEFDPIYLRYMDNFQSPCSQQSQLHWRWINAWLDKKWKEELQNTQKVNQRSIWILVFLRQIWIHIQILKNVKDYFVKLSNLENYATLEVYSRLHVLCMYLYVPVVSCTLVFFLNQIKKLD